MPLGIVIRSAGDQAGTHDVAQLRPVGLLDVFGSWLKARPEVVLCYQSWLVHNASRAARWVERTRCVKRSDLFRRSAHYIDRIFKGAQPSDLTVQNPSKFRPNGANLTVVIHRLRSLTARRHVVDQPRGGRVCRSSRNPRLASRMEHPNDHETGLAVWPSGPRGFLHRRGSPRLPRERFIHGRKADP